MYVLRQGVLMLFNLSYNDGVSQAYQHLADFKEDSGSPGLFACPVAFRRRTTA